MRIERLIIELGLEHPDLGLRALKIYQSYDQENQSMISGIAEATSNQMYQAWVNGGIPERFYNEYERERGQAVPYIGRQRVLSHEDHVDKHLRLEFLEIYDDFMERLASLALALKDIVHPDINT